MSLLFCCRCRAQRGEGDSLTPYLSGDVLRSSSLRSWLSGDHRCSKLGSSSSSSGGSSSSNNNNNRSGSNRRFRVLLRSSGLQQRGDGDSAAAAAGTAAAATAAGASSGPISEGEATAGGGGVSPCCFTGISGVYVPQVGDIVRYFPQLHQQPSLQHDRLQLWTPHAFSPCDAAIISIRYDFPGQPLLSLFLSCCLLSFTALFCLSVASPPALSLSLAPRVLCLLC